MTYYQGIQGGVLPLNSDVYVCREADDILYKSLLDGDNHVCCVLAARQMGKTSLMVRTAKRLTDEGIICLQTNLQSFGQVSKENSFYNTLLNKISGRIKENYDPNILETLRYFWDNQSDATSKTLLFQEFLKTEILPKINNKQFIVFLDEVQTLRNWELQNSFIGLMKAMFEEANAPFENLKFVLLGVINTSDLLTSADYVLNKRKDINLNYFNLNRDDKMSSENPLLKGLENISECPQDLLQAIISWTGGQPFLTQWLCHLVEKNWEKAQDSNVPQNVEELVKNKIIKKWRKKNQDKQDHFQSIENWFKIGYTKTDEKMAALNLYNYLWKQDKSEIFDSNKKEQVDLLISGLVTKKHDKIGVANPIYREVFDSDWIEKTKKMIIQKENKMPSTKIYNRDVFVLVDASDSMNDKDDQTKGKSRWDFLSNELLSGHIRKILGQANDQNKITDTVSLYFFGHPKNCLPFVITKPEDVKKSFEAFVPGYQTFICPAFKKCLEKWDNGGRKKGKGAFIIIYTDGQLSDETDFKNLVSKTCKDLDSQDELKIIMIGIGKEVSDNPLPFLELDYNMQNNTDKQGQDCDIFVFDLVNEMDGIIEILSCELEQDPYNVIPDWVKESFTNFYQKLLKRGSS